MDEKGIAFIIHQQEGQEVAELIDLLGQLRVPDGYRAEVVTIAGGKNRAAAYNAAMRQSQAKYKIYIDPAMRIFEEAFLEQLLGVFRQDTKIGLLGLSGAVLLSTHGICQTSQKRAGRIIIGRHPEQFIWEQSDAAWQEVMAVDGYLMATQYDIPWREDLFSGLSFFDTAQSIEFRRQGYKAAVPKQEDFWAYYIADGFPSDENSRNIFLDEYSKDVYPLVSIVIPTYNRPQYFQEALESVVHQTYRNLDIFITDNSHNDLTEKLMQDYLATDPRIAYEHHDEYDAGGNWARARSYDNPKAEYVNWLMDDDIFALDKIEKMMEYYLNETGITLVTSYRKLIDGDGDPLPDAPWNAPITKETKRFSGKVIGEAILANQFNMVGEPTTALVKKECMVNHHDLGWSGKEGDYLISDFPTWLRMLSQGDMVYITEPLSYFRWHEGQDQQSNPTKICGLICWASELQYAWEQGIFLTDLYVYKKTVTMWLKKAGLQVSQMAEMNYKPAGAVVVLERMQGFVNFLLQHKEIKYCPCCGEQMETFSLSIHIMKKQQ